MSWWLPVLTFVGGSGVSLAIAYIQSAERRSDRQAEATSRTAERQVLQDEDHRARQRTTLTELQEVLSDFIRAAGEGEFLDRQAWRAVGEPTQFNRPPWPDGLSEQINTLQRRFQVLKERIDDDEVREGVDLLFSLWLQSQSGPFVDSPTRLTEMGHRFVVVNAQIGRAFRAKGYIVQAPSSAAPE